MKVDILTFCTILLGCRGVIELLISSIALDLMSMTYPCPFYGFQGGSLKKITPSKNIDKLKVVVSWEGGAFLTFALLDATPDTHKRVCIEIRTPSINANVNQYRSNLHYWSQFWSILSRHGKPLVACSFIVESPFWNIIPVMRTWALIQCVLHVVY